ncbi:hypothetical protein FTUN_0050 [Frigoriglobus tundricola]|uniref:Uncharacterized protein n=1 Tax=Frigoriglobus tundricola TaxID=2774151 RepID=A0A6M5YG25_9BACT|nr:hypothetical protein FTUN_0050 [Frigoriglobus tundricola]
MPTLKQGKARRGLKQGLGRRSLLHSGGGGGGRGSRFRQRRGPSLAVAVPCWCSTACCDGCGGEAGAVSLARRGVMPMRWASTTRRRPAPRHAVPRCRSPWPGISSASPLRSLRAKRANEQRRRQVKQRLCSIVRRAALSASRACHILRAMRANEQRDGSVSEWTLLDCSQSQFHSHQRASSPVRSSWWTSDS